MYWSRYAYRTQLGQIGYGSVPQPRRGGSAGQGGGGREGTEAASAAGTPGISTSVEGSRGSRWGRGCLLEPRRHGLADAPPDHLPEALPSPGPTADAGAPREVVGEGEDGEPRGDEQRAGEEVGDAPVTGSPWQMGFGGEKKNEQIGEAGRA
ncbi:putative cuticle collagen 91 [Panicum virgatum]|uniref:putative cuticle collagen 91 n=1 Tax=Panicum virgatum TaxID=38727 RepID=UPI0019D5C8A2|nr:putative cuticle collagen 91 [Panicum virgatum]